MAVEIIAELGTAHGGNLTRAQRLIDVAAAAGANCCKTQIIFADEILHPTTGNVRLAQGSIDLYQKFSSMEHNTDFYRALMKRTHQHNLSFLVSVFGDRSLKIAQELGLRRIKIASPELNHIPLLTQVSRWASHIILSSGVSQLSDIEQALHCCAANNTTLLHCVTAYPAPEEQSNLRLIPALHTILGVPVGLSDHSVHPTLVATLAVACGATMIERHLTLDTDGQELDDPLALDGTRFTAMCHAIRRAERHPPATVIAQLKQEHTMQRVESILGDGTKHLAAAEAPHYRHTNRSILALKDIAAGEVIGRHNCTIVRSEQLTPGLAPSYWEHIQGARAQQFITAGRGLQWDDLLSRE